MSPVAFLQRPAALAGGHLATTGPRTSGGPNFAYDLCVRKATPEERAALDLSQLGRGLQRRRAGARARRWSASPRPSRPCGFRREAFYPCYGLAEAHALRHRRREAERRACTRAATPARWSATREPRPPRRRAHGADAGGLAAAALPDQRLLIVDPETRRAVRARTRWARSGSPAPAWRGATGTGRRRRRTPSARGSPAGEGPLPAHRATSASCAGRRAVRHRPAQGPASSSAGRNHYPQDLELTAERGHPALRPGCGAAFSVDVEGEERLVVVSGGGRARRPSTARTEVARAIRRAVAEEHEVQAHDGGAASRPGSLPKTSSGKIQRRACRADFLAGELEVVQASGERRPPVPEAVAVHAGRALCASAWPRRSAERAAALLERFLRGEAAAACCASAPAALDAADAADRPGPRLADGAGAARARWRRTWAWRCPWPSCWQDPTLGGCRRASAGRVDRAPPRPAAPPLEAGPRASGALPLSSGQQRLWFLDRLAARRAPLYNIHFAAPALGRAGRGRPAAAPARRSLAATRRCAPPSPRWTASRASSCRTRGRWTLAREDLRALSPGARGAAEDQLAPGRGARRPSTWQRARCARARWCAAGGPGARAADDAAPHRHRRLVHRRAGPRAGRALPRGGRRAGPAPCPRPPLQYADYARWQQRAGRALDGAARLLGAASWPGPAAAGAAHGLPAPAGARASAARCTASRCPAGWWRRSRRWAGARAAPSSSRLPAAFPALLHRY